MGIMGLPDEAGHSLTDKKVDPNSHYSSNFCTCGTTIWALAKQNGDADSRTTRRWRDHIALVTSPSDFEVTIGTVKKSRTTHTVKVFLTTHPDFHDYEPNGRCSYWLDKGGLYWCVALEKSGNYKNSIYLVSESQEDAIRYATNYVKKNDINFDTNLEAPDGVRIEVVSKSLLDATIGLLNESDALLETPDLDGLLAARTQIKEVLGIEPLLRQKLTELDSKVHEVMGVTA